MLYSIQAYKCTFLKKAAEGHPSPLFAYDDQ